MSRKTKKGQVFTSGCRNPKRAESFNSVCGYIPLLWKDEGCLVMGNGEKLTARPPVAERLAA
jgi:hypothetical protein